MLDASNLGQIIGRLLYSDESRAAAASRSAPAEIRRDRRAQILAFVAGRGRVELADLVAELGMTGGNASVHLHNMHQDGQLARSGDRGSYVYTLP